MVQSQLLPRVSGIVIAALTVNCLVGSANAQQVIAICGASKGKAFYLEPTKEGWVDDGISNGTITFLRNPSGDYDILVKSAGPAFSARGDGAQVVKVHGADESIITLIVIYPLHVTEVYQLTLNANGRGTLIWSNLKNRSAPMGITRGAVFVAECSR